MGKLGRFQVMALLQAARYYLITHDIKRAYSFGLNRAIFYAWAKKYGRSRIPSRPIRRGEKEVVKIRSDKGTLIYFGDEGAFVSDNGWFIIGGDEQTPDDYERNIVRRIESIVDYEKAWNAALEYLRQFSKDTLLSQRKFYAKIYKPVRDNFLEIIEKYSSKPKTKQLKF